MFNVCEYYINSCIILISNPTLKVRNNWWNRIRETSKYAKEYCEQVKRCTEIALNCIEVEKEKRPTIVDVIHELKKTETAVIHETVEEDVMVSIFPYFILFVHFCKKLLLVFLIFVHQSVNLYRLD